MHSFFKSHAITSRPRHLQSLVFQPSGHYISSLFVIDKSLKAAKYGEKSHLKPFSLEFQSQISQPKSAAVSWWHMNVITWQIRNTRKDKNILPSATSNLWGKVAKRNLFTCCIVFLRCVCQREKVWMYIQCAELLQIEKSTLLSETNAQRMLNANIYRSSLW